MCGATPLHPLCAWVASWRGGFTFIKINLTEKCAFICKMDVFSLHCVSGKEGFLGAEITALFIMYKTDDTHEQMKLSNELNPQAVRLAIQ